MENSKTYLGTFNYFNKFCTLLSCNKNLYLNPVFSAGNYELKLMFKLKDHIHFHLLSRWYLFVQVGITNYLLNAAGDISLLTNHNPQVCGNTS